MLVVSWISMLWFLQYGSALGHHTRHERTRYVSGRNQIYGSYSPNFEQNQNYIPFVHFWERPLQILESSMNVPKKLSSRPLFSWDIPVPLSTYNPTRKSFTTTQKPIEPLNDVSSPVKESKENDNNINPVTLEPKTTQKTRSDRLNRAKDLIAYEKPHTYLKKRKSTNRKKSIEESPRVIRWRQADAQSPEKVENEPKRLKRKKKGKKSKKLKMEKLKRNKTGGEKLKSEMNDGVIDINSSSDDGLGEVLKSKILLEKRKQEEVLRKTTTTESPPTPTTPPCDLLEEKCEHRCENENGTAKCVCFRGFTPVGHRCVDINECEINNGNCNGRCVNTLGSRKCICSPGFRLLDGVCSDINECLLRNGHGPCQDQCTNTFGSYSCSCEGLPGTTLSANKHTCEENNECASSSSGCSHSCISVSGRTFCTCPDGMELGDDWKTCHDIDECSNPEDYDVECPTTCVNTIGSYTCTRGNTTKENFT